MMFAAVNYRDCMVASTPQAQDAKVRALGNEGVGIVEESRCPAISPGDVVFVNGAGLGSERDGTLASHVIVPHTAIVPLPVGLAPRQAAMFGSAGMVAMLALGAMEAAEFVPSSGPVAVTGASGGVGRTSVALLAAAGLQVAAITRRLENARALSALGAASIEAPPEVGVAQSQEFLAERWAGAVDVVGDGLLNWLLRAARPASCICSAGITGGFTLTTNLASLILRNVTLMGITARMPREKRVAAFSRIAVYADGIDIERLGRFISMDKVPDALVELREGRANGRTVVQFP